MFIGTVYLYTCSTGPLFIYTLLKKNCYTHYYIYLTVIQNKMFTYHKISEMFMAVHAPVHRARL